MKRFLITLFSTMLLLTLSTPSFAQTKLEKRYAYTLKHLKLDKATEAKFAPVLKAYLTERKQAGDIYDDLKKKFKAAEKAGTLTDAQATQLLNAKLDSEGKVLIVMRKYLAEFKKVLPAKKIYYAFDYANDKISKIDGKEE